MSDNEISEEFGDDTNFLQVPNQWRELKNSSSLEMVNLATLKNESKVMVLYTGGTIGMMPGPTGEYIPVPNTLEQCLKRFPHLHDNDYAQQYFKDEKISPLVLPELRDTGTRRVVYTISEYSPLLDSCNITMDDWVHIATDIKKYYDKFDGFVILHGTDTMSYTASALSFMLENLGKSIVITGSQIPLFQARSDGRDNLIGALIMAGNHCIPEVTIFFDNKLFRGNRTTKVNVNSFEAFNSPNLTPLGRVGINVFVDKKAIFRPTKIAIFNVHCQLEPNVGLLRLFPGITIDTVETFLKPPMKGVVLQTYGAGNAPSQRKDIMNSLKKASARGIIIINITQCVHGSVEASYETGKALVDAGVIPGSDMTPEAALTKLNYVLGKDQWDLERKKKELESNIRGELTSLYNNDEPAGDLFKRLTEQLTDREKEEMINNILLPSMMCSFAYSGDLRMFDLWEERGDATAADFSGRTPLHLACAQGHTLLVEHLLRNGALIHHKDFEGRTPLQLAIERCHYDVIELLCKAGGHLNQTPTSTGDTLCVAAANGNVPLLKSFVVAGIDILKQVDSCGRTVLQVAKQCNQEEVIQYLDEDLFSTRTSKDSSPTPEL